jgi:hypothetical protein
VKWSITILLLINVIYFGWELSRETANKAKNTQLVRTIPSDASELELITKSNLGLLEVKPVTVEQELDVDTDEPVITDPLPDLLDNELVSDLPDIDLSIGGPDVDSIYCFTFGPLAEQVMAYGLSDWFNVRRASAQVRTTIERGEQLLWIYLAPQVSHSLALDKVRELQDKGIEDFRVISRGNLQNAISLGVFSSQAAVNARLGELKEQGLNPVVVPYYDEKNLYWLDVKMGAGYVENGALFNGLPSRYNYIPVDCDKI